MGGRSSSSSSRDEQLSSIQQDLITKFVVLVVLLLHTTTRVDASIGVNFGRIADNLPPASEVASFVKSQGIDKVKIYDADPDILNSFAGTGVSVAVMVPNEIIQDIASNPSSAQNWISSNVAPHFPSTKITSVMVGNEILTRADPGISPYLVPAMRNIYNALSSLQLSDSIKVTTPHAFDVLDSTSSFPPSSGAFKDSLLPIMQPLVEFLADTGSFFMIDVYPYFAYKDNSQSIPLDYALFSPSAAGVQDSNTGLQYSNLFDAQLDAVYAALKRLNHGNLDIVVSETGWPSAGDPNDTGATLDNAATYNRNLISHVTQNPPKGTPMRPGVSIDTYIFELFNEDQKTGSSSERNFGLFYPNMTKVGKLSPLPVFPSTYGGSDAAAAHCLQQQLLPWTCLLVALLLLLHHSS